MLNAPGLLFTWLWPTKRLIKEEEKMNPKEQSPQETMKRQLSGGILDYIEASLSLLSS